MQVNVRKERTGGVRGRFAVDPVYVPCRLQMSIHGKRCVRGIRRDMGVDGDWDEARGAGAGERGGLS